jgi:hypothetical protein
MAPPPSPHHNYLTFCDHNTENRTIVQNRPLGQKLAAFQMEEN